MALAGVDRAHDADTVAVGVAHHGVAGAPEGVVGRLLHRHAVGRQGGHQGVDLVPRLHLEAEDGPAAAGPTLFHLAAKLSLSRSTSSGVVSSWRAET